MPFLSAGGKTYKTRVYDRAGQGHVRTLATRDEREAEEFETLLARLRRNRRWDALDLIIAGELAVPDVYDADAAGTLAKLVADTRAREAADALAAADIDLSPLVAEWNGQGRRARSDKYVSQVRRMIPEGERFPLSEFRRKRISEFLARLPINRATKNRYRQALLQFGNWLVEREVLEANPVRDVKGYGENDPNLLKYEREEAQRIIAALPSLKLQAIEAMMAGAAIEWQAVTRVRRMDIDTVEHTIYADGGKNRWRRRTVVVTEEWCWDIIRGYVRAWDTLWWQSNTIVPIAGAPRLPTEPLFGKLDHHAVLAAHHEACRAVGVHDSGLHDWRDSYAYWNLWLDGVEPAYLRPQFGHAPNSTTLERTYAAWIPTPLQRRERAQRAQARTAPDTRKGHPKVTNPATSSRRRVK